MAGLKPVPARDYLQALYLLRLVQTGAPAAASAATEADIRRWRAARPHVQADEWTDLLRDAVRTPAPPSAPLTALDPALARVGRMAEPDRSALTLTLAELLPAGTVADTLSLDPAAAAALTKRAHAGWAAVAGGVQSRDETALSLREALARARLGNPELAALTASLMSPPHEPAAKTVPGPAAVAPATHSGARLDGDGAEDEDDDEAEAGAAGVPRRRRDLPRTVIAAITVGLVGTVAIAWFVIYERLGTFSGAERVSELLDSANGLTGDEFEPVTTSAKDLEDYFFLKHGLEHYAVPRELGELRTVGCRVTKMGNADIAEVMATGPKEILLYLFQPEDLDVRVHSNRWEIVDGENWVGGLRRENGMCCLVSFRGTRAEMEAFLKSRGR